MEREIQFDRNLKILRKRAGLTRRDLAQRINYTDKAIEKWESGQSVPPLSVLCQIAQELGVGLETLVYTHCNEVRYFLGIDGGGTKTAFRLEDACGTVIAQCELGASNPNDIGMEQCAAVLRSGILEATAGVNRRETAVFAGLAGGISDSNVEGIRKVLAQYEFGFMDNGSDVDNALEMCLQGHDGVAVIAGTGSIAFAQKNGERQRVGGWGYLLDGGGSGYNLGRDALEAAFRDMDGRGRKTILTQLLEARFGKPLDQAIPELYSGGKRLIASLAPLVFEACGMADAEAAGVLRRNAAYLAELIQTAAKFVGDPTAPVVVCGGLAHRGDLLETYIREFLQEPYDLRFCEDPMVTGAVMCARRKYAEYGKTE